MTKPDSNLLSYGKEEYLFSVLMKLIQGNGYFPV